MGYFAENAIHAAIAILGKSNLDKATMEFDTRELTGVVSES